MRRFQDSLYSFNIAVVTKYHDSLYKVTNHNCLINSGLDVGNDRAYSEKGTVNDEKLANNISRAKRSIREYALCNEWDYFITLTQDQLKVGDRYDLDQYIKDLGVWLRNRYYPRGIKIDYLLIPEKHQDGAWHIHGLIRGLPDDEIEPNEFGYLDWQAYRDKFGWCSLGRIKDKNKIASYIVKYISKDLSDSRELEKKLYYCSRGLKKAQIIKKETLPPDSSFSPSYENDFCQMAFYKSVEDVEALFSDVNYNLKR